MNKSIKTTINITNAIAMAAAVYLSTYAFIASNTFAQTQNLDSKIIKLYLPLRVRDYPDLPKQLEQALSAKSLANIKVETTDFWHPYHQGIRKGRTGIYFTQPHFAAWSISKYDFQAIYKLHGELKYVLATNRANASIFEISDLAGKTICREASLSLGSIWLNDLIGEQQISVHTDEVTSTRQAMLGDQYSNSQQTGVQNLCHAYVIDEFNFDLVNKHKRGQYIRLAQSKIYQHNVFIASQDVSNQTVKKLKLALKSKTVKRILAPYFSSLSKWQNLQIVDDTHYDGNDAELLEPYWGF